VCQSRLELTHDLERLRVIDFDIMLNSHTKNAVTLMLHTTNPFIKHKTGLLNLAEELSNVT